MKETIYEKYGDKFQNCEKCQISTLFSINLTSSIKDIKNPTVFLITFYWRHASPLWAKNDWRMKASRTCSFEVNATKKAPKRCNNERSIKRLSRMFDIFWFCPTKLRYNFCFSKINGLKSSIISLSQKQNMGMFKNLVPTSNKHNDFQSNIFTFGLFSVQKPDRNDDVTF